MRRLALALCVASVTAVPALADDHAGMKMEHGMAMPIAHSDTMIHATVVGLDGKDLGMVMLQDTPTGVLVTADLKGLPAGEHGFHFHEKGVCDPAQKFATAGGHFAPGGTKHGLLVAGGPHGGDMPNQHVGADGVLDAQVLNTGVTLAPGDHSLLDADGSALVIHAKPDDYKTQPSGDAGDRIACAVIKAG